MDYTGGSYMQQPSTSSEAVKRCLTIPHRPLSSQVRIVHKPHPPFANGHRPTSAPARRTTYTYHSHSDPPRNPSVLHNRYIQDTHITRHAPYARRTAHDSSSSLGYSVSDNGTQSGPIPDYNSFNDPHLLDYFTRKFAYLDYETRSSSRYSDDSRTGLLRKRKSQREKPANEVVYKVSITTADKKNAGTDAKVYFRMKGSKGKLPKTRLMKKAGSVKSNKDVAFRFAKGSTHTFKIRALDIGNVKSIILEQTGCKKADAWYVQEVDIVNMKSKKTWTFICNQWLSLHHGDGQPCREFFPKQSSKTDYEVVVVTGDKLNAGTKANVFMTLFGKTGVTPKIRLHNNTKSVFDRGSSDVFLIHTNCVGPMTKLRIEHDGTGLASGWYVERIVVSDLRNPRWKYFFPCGQWLARDEGDHAICRDLIGSRDPLAIRKGAKYKVTVYTGNVSGAGTDAMVYITMFGENGESGERILHSTKKPFQRGKTDEFILECPRLGRLERIRVGHNNTGFKPGWFLEKMIIDDLDLKTVYVFPCERWLAEDEDDGQIARELAINVGPMDCAPGIPYVITVKTGNKQNAGTDANVFLELISSGKNQETSGKIWLKDGVFKRDMTDKFQIDVGKMLSPLSRLDVGHDNSGVASGWFLDSITVYCPNAGIEQFFPHGKWLATDEGDQVVQVSLYEQKAMRKKKEKKDTWCVWVFTSDIKGAGTNANVQIAVYGDKSKSDDISLDTKGDPFEHGHMDRFKINVTDIGKPYKLRVWHDNSGMLPGWHLDKIVMENVASKEKYNFPCKRWLADDEDDHEIVRELPAEGPGIRKPLPVVHYTIEVHTGKKTFAGTDANVYIDIFGDLGDTGKRFLKKSSAHKNKFEKGNVDIFSIEAVTLMKLNKIRIGHDGKGLGAGWFLDRVVVKQDGTDKYDTTFECDRWLDEDQDDGLIERELMAKGLAMLNTTAYHIHVKTGDVRNAGTDANVHLKIFGTKGDTGLLHLNQSESGKNKFEQNRTDLFHIDASDIGDIKKIRIGHNGHKPGSGWFLDSVTIDIPSRGLQYMFAAHRWLAKDEEDKQIEIELEPSVKEEREKVIPYEVTVWTKDKAFAGTDSKVFIQMYGELKKTEEIPLSNKTDNFEQGKEDKFKVEALDIGHLKKLRVGHDGTGSMSGWYLEKILIKRQPVYSARKRHKRPMSAAERRQSILSSYRSDRDDEDSDSGHQVVRRKKKRGSVQDKIDEMDEQEPYDGTETEDYWFYVDKWFSKGEGDGAIVKEFVPTDIHGRPLEGALDEVEYVVKVYTGDVNWAGTDANVYLTLHGEKGDSGERHLDKTSHDSEHLNKFEKNQEDCFTIKAVDLGTLKKLRIRHDNKLGGADWFLDRVEVEDKKRKKHYFFPCQRWLATTKDDCQIARDLVPVDPLLKKKLSRKDSTAVRDEIALEMKAALTTYHVKVTTGKDWGASTDANVYIDLYGENNNSDKIYLKSSLTNKNKFQKGKTDEFVLEVAQIGDLKKIKIGHDNAGGGAAWQLDSVVVDAPSLGKTWKFPCGRWLSLKEDDGLLERELYPQELATEDYNPCIPYEITTYTSDVQSAGTDADVYVILYGRDKRTEAKSLCPNKKERKDRYERKSVDKFVVEMEDVGDTIEKLRIGHDGSGFGAGWHLEKVEVRKLQESGKPVHGSITYVFPCDRWLAKGEDDNAIVRELLPKKATKEIIKKDGEVKKMNVNISDNLTEKMYTVHVITGDFTGGGTDANVFITVFGNKGDSGERPLSKSETHRDKFEKGNTDTFKIEAVDLGELYKIKIRHDNAMFKPAWFLDHVEIEEPDKKDKYVFHCERWLAKNKEDGKIERTLYVKGYDGDMSSTATLRSNAFGSLSSMDSLQSGDPFSKSPRVKRSSVCLERVPEGPTIPYTIKLSTGDGEDNGTDSNVWIKIIGPRKVHTGKLFLQLAQKDKFLPGSVERFSIDAFDVVEVKKVEIGHDGTAPGSGWFLKEIEVDLPTKGKHYHFKCEQWLDRHKSDGQTSRIFSVDDGLSSITSFTPLIPYEVTVYTGDVSGGGTDSKITMTVFGSKGSTTPTELPKTEDRFERAKIDTLKMELDDVGHVKKIRMAIDGKGNRSSWFLEKVELRNLSNGSLSTFHYKDWLGKTQGQGDGRMSVDLPAMERGKVAITKTDYKVTVKTSDVRGAGTDANVYIVMFGSNGDSGDIHLRKSDTNRSPFETNQTDVFILKGLLSLGELSKLRIWHDNKGMGAAWHLTSVDVEDLDKKKSYTFICDKWLSKSDGDKQIVRELTCVGPIRGEHFGGKEKVVYEIEVATTDKKDGGTIHNAWLILEGSLKTSKVFQMENSNQNKILRGGQRDNFKMVSPPLGRLERCILGAFKRDDVSDRDHQPRALEWHCHEVIVTDTNGGDKYTFVCKSWIPIEPRINRHEGKVLKVKEVEASHVAVVRNLAPIQYDVVFVTGDLKGAGTSAKVFLTIFGQNGDTGKRSVNQTWRSFGKNQKDQFRLEALDLGELTKVIVEHDSDGLNPSWYLDYVEVINVATNQTTKFPCHQWLDKERGVRCDLYPENT